MAILTGAYGDEVVLMLQLQRLSMCAVRKSMSRAN